MKIDGVKWRPMAHGPVSPQPPKALRRCMNVTLGPVKPSSFVRLPTDVSSRIRIKLGCLAAAIRARSRGARDVSGTRLTTALPLRRRLASGVTLANASRVVTNCRRRAFPTSQFSVRAIAGAGTSTLTQLRWSTAGPTISYSARVLAGPGAP